MSRLKLMLPGFDIKDDDPSHAVLDNRYPSPKIDVLANPPHAGVITLNFTSSNFQVPDRGITRTLYSFPHHYDYAPGVIGQYALILSDQPTGFVAGSFIGMLPEVFVDGATGNTIFLITIDSDINNVNIDMLGLHIGGITVDAFVLKIRFYVFAERGHE